MPENSPLLSIWDAYPASYRQSEVAAICAAVRAGECVSLVGLSGAGKSNLVGFLCARVRAQDLPAFVLVDCNRLAGNASADLFALLAETLAGLDDSPEAGPAPAGLRGLEKLLERCLAARPAGLCLVLDRFDALPIPAVAAAAGSLRALRDRVKYRLTYLVAARRPLAPETELAELFYANTLWLGPLSPADARWSAAAYASRRGLAWDQALLARLCEISWGYPSLLRAVCEACAAGAALETASLRAHPAVQRRTAEFWLDHPSPQELRLSGLEGQPLLADSAPVQIDPALLTPAEQRLLAYLQAHPGQVCPKDDLVVAVWLEEAFTAGVRDESLAQLVHRLRDKIGARFIQTVPARGYRFTP